MQKVVVSIRLTRRHQKSSPNGKSSSEVTFTTFRCVTWGSSNAQGRPNTWYATELGDLKKRPGPFAVIFLFKAFGVRPLVQSKHLIRVKRGFSRAGTTVWSSIHQLHHKGGDHNELNGINLWTQEWRRYTPKMVSANPKHKMKSSDQYKIQVIEISSTQSLKAYP